LNILVLSNDEKDREVIDKTARHLGHQVLMTGDSDNAMQRLQDGGYRFVIVDRNSTDADERGFVKAIRDAQPPYYIYILLAALKVSEGDVTTPRGGADDYIHKPINPLALKTRINIGERMIGLGDNLVDAKFSLEKNAMFDPLTKTLNESAFLSLAKGDLERARRGQVPMSMIAFELINYKEIGNIHGQKIISDVLILLSQSMREKSRTYDSIGRSGPNVFLVPLPGVIGIDAEKIADRILTGIRNTNITTLENIEVQVNVRAGIATTQRVSTSVQIDEFVRKAREAALRAEANSENQIQTIFI